jgi:hypothetical protein
MAASCVCSVAAELCQGLDMPAKNRLSLLISQIFEIQFRWDWACCLSEMLPFGPCRFVQHYYHSFRRTICSCSVSIAFARLYMLSLSGNNTFWLAFKGLVNVVKQTSGLICLGQEAQFRSYAQGPLS